LLIISFIAHDQKHVGELSPRACRSSRVAHCDVALQFRPEQIFVALEFINNSDTDFWGEHNIIRKGGTFYLLGKLVIPSETTSTFQWPTDVDPLDLYVLPPYDQDGKTIKRERVFVQDYMTEANFKIGPTSLRHAYLTVPDLRSSQLSLGLSVDLQWRNGRTYTYILGGN
ncbi:MAG: hypothetical protein J5694_01690, partial [Erysipelotrichaceae bacterium]|nr:hypothetical protein [Erysipelotrichaceae bacterium]